MNPKELKALLVRKIDSLDRVEHSKDPGKDFYSFKKSSIQYPDHNYPSHGRSVNG